MPRHIAIVQGHPDGASRHLLHALADAYAAGATNAGYEVRRIEVATLDFPLLRVPSEFESGDVPPALDAAAQDLRWAQHWVFFFPLWHGALPALFKAFVEQVFRPGFAMDYGKGRGMPKRLLAGRSARVVVTMGMPALMYRLGFGAFGVRAFERSVLAFAGVGPIRTNLLGLTFANEAKRARWLTHMRRLGERGI